MPGYLGARGLPVNLGMGLSMFPTQTFHVPYRKPRRFVLTGTALDSVGAPLGNAEVDFWDPVAKLWVANTISDASGNYIIDLPESAVVQGIAYKAGAPELDGVTTRGLIPVPA